MLHEVTHVFTHADKGIFAFVPPVLRLSWAGASWRALLPGLLAGSLNFGVNYTPNSRWYVLGQQ